LVDMQILTYPTSGRAAKPPSGSGPSCRSRHSKILSLCMKLTILLYKIGFKRAQNMDLDRWVNDNNPDEQLQYSKGWWDYIELIRRLMYKFGAKEARVVATYPMRTPPPEEDLLMPAVQFAVGSTEFIVKYDFGVYPERWTVSVKNAIAVVRPILGLFDDKQDLRGTAVAGFDAECIHGSYHNDSTCFTCEIHDEWDLSALVRLVSHQGA
jgi:hypothetical protein